MSLEVTMRKHFILLLYSTSLITQCAEISIPLLGAARLGSKKLTQKALGNGADPNIYDELGNTPLHYAVHLGSKSITELLLTYHANPNIKNNKGKTALDIAIQTENNYLIRRLLLYGAQPHEAKQYPKHITCLLQKEAPSQNSVNVLTKKYIQCAKTTKLARLQHLGAYSTINKNAQIGKHKRTALMYAARNNRTAIASYLVNHIKVDTTIKDVDGKTARDYAKKHNNPKLLEILS